MSLNKPAKELITYQESQSFTPLALDLHSSAESLRPFAGKFFSMDTLSEQIQIKAQHPINREVLVDALLNQYQGVKISDHTRSNINLLRDNNTFTVTTGHQLCLFTGPLYFVYKIIHTINLAKKASEQNPDHNIVPIFWMATEDHDFPEVASATINGGKLTWNKDSENKPVGRLTLEDIEPVFKSLEHILGPGPRANEILQLLRKCYSSNNLAQATRSLVNELFGKYGIVILDGDSPSLKALFAPVVKSELETSVANETVGPQTQKLAVNYKTQVNPRECNLFLFKDGVRRRIDKTPTGFVLADSGTEFSLDQLLKRLSDSPEDFSPNVIMRPVYQEVILPNLAYIGGGGELAYWLQLRTLFESLSIPFPLLVLRNSVQIIEADQKLVMDKLDITIKQVFNPKEELYKELLSSLESEDFYKLGSQLAQYSKQYEELSANVSVKDPSLKAHIEANWKREEKFLHGLEKKLYRVAKVKHDSSLRQIDKLKAELFPGGGLQERKENIFTYVYRYGFQLLDALVEELDPENKEFTVLLV